MWYRLLTRANRVEIAIATGRPVERINDLFDVAQVKQAAWIVWQDNDVWFTALIPDEVSIEQAMGDLPHIRKKLKDVA